MCAVFRRGTAWGLEIFSGPFCFGISYLTPVLGILADCVLLHASLFFQEMQETMRKTVRSCGNGFVRFRKWSRKAYASFLSLHLQVSIGCLSKGVCESLFRKSREGKVFVSFRESVLEWQAGRISGYVPGLAWSGVGCAGSFAFFPPVFFPAGSTGVSGWRGFPDKGSRLKKIRADKAGSWAWSGFFYCFSARKYFLFPIGIKGRKVSVF